MATTHRISTWSGSFSVSFLLAVATEPASKSAICKSSEGSTSGMGVSKGACAGDVPLTGLWAAYRHYRKS